MAEPGLDKQRHIKYWHMCLNSLLPNGYTSTDSSRCTLGFFILSALDLLGVGADSFSELQRNKIRSWILKCQHPYGGFCGSSNHRFPDAYYTDPDEGEKDVDPANLPATFFALVSLGFVGGFDGVDRQKCLCWLRRLQRADGSFGELVTPEGTIWGGRDMRYCYLATATRWILRADDEIELEDIDVEGLVRHIRSGQTYDGGISESSEHEAHAGYTYCAIASLSLLNRLPNSPKRAQDVSPGLSNIPQIIQWLMSRQVASEEGEDEDEEEEEDQSKEQDKVESPTPLMAAGVYNGDNPDDHRCVGFNGRCNKRVDTCYAFWVTACLDLLGDENSQLLDVPAIQRFLFTHTQHPIGGFAKSRGNPPDIYHSYLGLAAIAMLKRVRVETVAEEETETEATAAAEVATDLKPLDASLCISREHKKRLERYREEAIQKSRINLKTYWKHGFPFFIREDDPYFEAKMTACEHAAN